MALTKCYIQVRKNGQRIGFRVFTVYEYEDGECEIKYKNKLYLLKVDGENNLFIEVGENTQVLTS